MAKNFFYHAWKRRRRYRVINDTVTVNVGVQSLLFDGTELTTGAPNSPTPAYPAFPGLERAANGDFLMVYRRSDNHGISVNSSIRQSRSTNQGASWQDRMAETIIVPISASYDPYSPSLKRLANGNLVLKYEKDWATGGTATSAVTVTSNVARATVPANHGHYVGQVITTTGLTQNATSVAIVAVGATTVDYPLTRADGPLADGVGAIISDLERSVHVRISTDNGATYGSEITVAQPTGLSPALRYFSAGGPVVQLANGDLISADYYRQVNQLRYSAYCSVSTDGGATWTYRALIAQDPNTGNSTTPGNWGFQFEEPQIVATGATSLLALVRVDDTVGTLGDNALDSQIFVVTSSDSGVTWSSYVNSIAFHGNGWPAVTRLTNGVFCAVTRDNLDTGGLTQRPMLWVSRTGASGSWEGPTFFGDDSLTSPRYMYAGLMEHPTKTNVLCVGYGQEVTLNNSCRIAYAEFGINASAQLPTYRSTRSALWGNANNSWCRYDSPAFLDGATRLIISFRERHDTNAGGTQNVIGFSTANRQLRVYWSSGTTLNVAIATGAGTEASWTSAASLSVLDHNSHYYIVYDGTETGNAARLRVWQDGVEVSGGGSFSGTIPASIRTSTSSMFLGASSADDTTGTAGSNPRTRYIEDLIMWTGVTAATAAAAVTEIMNSHVTFDPRTSTLGTPAAWVPLDGSFTATLGLTNPTLTGSDITHSSRWVFGPGYLG